MDFQTFSTFKILSLNRFLEQSFDFHPLYVPTCSFPCNAVTSFYVCALGSDILIVMTSSSIDLLRSFTPFHQKAPIYKNYGSLQKHPALRDVDRLFHLPIYLVLPREQTLVESALLRT